MQPERARMIEERMRSKGDNEGADTWLRIIVAIGELGAPTEVIPAAKGEQHGRKASQRRRIDCCA